MPAAQTKDDAVVVVEQPADDHVDTNEAHDNQVSEYLEHIVVGPADKIVFRMPSTTPQSVAIDIAAVVAERFGAERTVVLMGDVKVSVISDAEG